jgi:hypothetical protein
MDRSTESVLKLDLANLTADQIKYLHDLKAEAIKGWAARALIELKGAN